MCLTEGSNIYIYIHTITHIHILAQMEKAYFMCSVLLMERGQYTADDEGRLWATVHLLVSEFASPRRLSKHDLYIFRACTQYIQYLLGNFRT